MPHHLATIGRPPDLLRTRRRGFTLFEMVLASLLMAIIMAAAWMLLGTYHRQFERSLEMTERWQLSRSLRQTIYDDFERTVCAAVEGEPLAAASRSDTSTTNSAASEPSEGSPTERTPANRPSTSDSGSLLNRRSAAMAADPSLTTGDPAEGEMMADLEGVPSFGVLPANWKDAVVGFFGNGTSVVLDVLTPVTELSQPVLIDELAEDELPPADVTRRVVYHFVSPDDLIESEVTPGLTRFEFTQFELDYFRADTHSDQMLEEIVRTIDLEWGEPDADEELLDQSLEPLPTPMPTSQPGDVDLESLTDGLLQRIDRLPEFVMFQLRYYDGQQWLSQWDSRSAGTIPVAVELRFKMKEREAIVQSRREEAEALWGSSENDVEAEARTTLAEAETADVEMIDDEQRSSQTTPPDYERFVFFLRPADAPAKDSGLIDGFIEDAIISEASR